MTAFQFPVSNYKRPSGMAGGTSGMRQIQTRKYEPEMNSALLDSRTASECDEWIGALRGPVMTAGFSGPPAYRCSLLDAARNVRSVEHLDCHGDTEAIIQAINILADQTRYPCAEVWCGARIVARLPKPDADHALQFAKQQTKGSRATLESKKSKRARV